MPKNRIEFDPAPNDAVNLSFLVPHYRSFPIYGELCNLSDPRHQLSMLHPDVLALLYHFGCFGKGNILELGPFVGGSTIALALGMRGRATPQRIVSVEIGGSYEHITLGTDNIVRDLNKNLENSGVRKLVDLVIGNSRDKDVVNQVTSLTGPKSIGLIFADTDGHVANDLQLYEKLLCSDAYLIVDDYYAPGASEKAEITRTDIDKLTAEGSIECLGVYGWGTWVGRMKS